jgi:peptidoglycan/LPS O-acetylase OafA/YrhL|tara:strand:- start:29172 stop:31172 length:2001 start_codon:yes stop_codon:yes gene_type:complete
MTHFRADINGLRAIAVLLVIFNHASISFFKGGFIGVDVFFIISGFLITTMITKALSNGEFSFASFYASRARRLLPAFHLVCLASLLISYFFLLSTDFSNTIVKMISGLFFVKNFSLMLGVNNYFDSVVTAEFFVHIWSLSVEEQFYLLWPLLLLLSFKLKIKYVLTIFVCVILSLIYSQSLVEHDAKNAYYLVLSRVFQFGIGALVVFIPPLKSKKINAFISYGGMFILLGSLWVIDKDTLYPGLYALLPSLGTALVIYAGVVMTPTFNKVLGNSVFNYTGLISYSLYLWHWPVFVLIKYLHYEMTFYVIAIALIATYSLATLSYYLIEQPLRHRKISNQAVFFQYFFIPTGVLLCSILFVDKGSLQGDIAKEHYQLLNDKEIGCFSLQPTTELPDLTRCTTDPTKPADTLIWGDSHAAYMANFIKELKLEGSSNIVHITHAACPPVIEPFFVYDKGQKARKDKSCVVRNEQVMNYIKKQNFKYIYLVARWPLYINGNVKENWRDLNIFMLEDLQEQALNIDNNKAVFAKKFTQTIEQLLALNITPIIVQNAPGNFKDPSRCHQINNLAFANQRNCDQKADYIIDKNNDVNALFTALDKSYDLLKFIPVQYLLCDKDICSTTVDNKPVYYDDDHASQAGAMYLGQKYMAELTSTVLKEHATGFYFE